jgi:LacI family transcriptional regulator
MATRTSGTPKYVEVSAALERQIRLGKWEGRKLPGVRGIADQHRVSVVTASRALQILRDKGLVQTIERSGCYRVPPPAADRWALVARTTPGAWQQATYGLVRGGFDAVARREPMHLEADLFPPSSGPDEHAAHALVRRAKDAGVGGVFLLPSRLSEAGMRADERLLACCGAEGLPVVLLERNLRGEGRPLERDLVAVDDLDGAARCTRHLLDLGRRRVGLVVASPTSSHNDRVAGYLYALHTFMQSTVRKADSHRPAVLRQCENLPDRDAHARLADQVIRLKLDALVCYQDYTAVGLIVELLARGLKVPDDVAVTGFDNLPIGHVFAIGVTTYAYPAEGIAEQALRLMRERLKNPDRPPVKVAVPGRLIVRESSVGRAG